MHNLNWTGSDACIETSLFEYGFIAADDEVDSDYDYVAIVRSYRHGYYITRFDKDLVEYLEDLLDFQEVEDTIGTTLGELDYISQVIELYRYYGELDVLPPDHWQEFMTEEEVRKLLNI